MKCKLYKHFDLNWDWAGTKKKNFKQSLISCVFNSWKAIHMKYCTNMSSGLSSREGGWRTDKEWWRGCWPCLYICMFKKLKRLAHTGLTFDLDLPQPSLHVISNPWLHMLVRWLYMIVLWRLACLPQTVYGLNTHTPLYKWQQVHEQTNTLHKHTHSLTYKGQHIRKASFFLHFKLCLHLLFLTFLVYFELHLKIYIFAVWVSLLVREKGPSQDLCRVMLWE